MRKFILFFAVYSILLMQSAMAATISVSSTDDEYTDNEVCSLREAITNTNGDFNTFDECVPDGAYGDDIIILTDDIVSYTLSVNGSNEDNNISGDLDIRDVLTIQGGTIDAVGLATPDRILNTVDANAQLTLDGVTLQNGRINDTTGGVSYTGGCIYAPSGISLTIQNSSLENCTVQTELGFSVTGGLIFSYIPLSISNSNFIGGLVERTVDSTGLLSSDGSAIYASLSALESVTISQSNFASNTSYNEFGVATGALYIDGTDLATVDSTVFYYNNTTSDNANSFGSAISINNVTEFRLTNSTIQQSTLNGVVTHGGGIYAQSTDTLKITNSTLTDNVAQGSSAARGGALLLSSADVYLSFVTMSNNIAGDDASTSTSAGGAFHILIGDVYMIHSIIAGNNVEGVGTLDGPDCYSGVLTSLGYNQIGDDTDCTTLDGTDEVGSVLNLQPADDNGGNTQTIALGAGSAALDSAHVDCLDAEGNPVTQDQRGAPRVAGSCDIGAYEYGLFYEDNDSDTFGNYATETAIFTAGLVTDNTDCDDMLSFVNPDATELCDGIDNDCDASIDEDFTDLGDDCSDGVGACEASGTMVCNSEGTATECDATASDAVDEVCGDDADNDCDGDTDSDDADCAVAGDDDDDTTDTDGDGVEDNTDNCPDDVNEEQADEDSDGIGDACDFDSDATTSSSGCHLASQASAPNTFLVIATALASVWFIRMRTRKAVSL